MHKNDNRAIFGTHQTEKTNAVVSNSESKSVFTGVVITTEGIFIVNYCIRSKLPKCVTSNCIVHFYTVNAR